jgi:hypothetical protein
LKFGTLGGAIWATISQLATTPAIEHVAIYRESRAPAERVSAVLAKIQEYSLSIQLLAHGYVPGMSGALDRMLRMDIERVDEMLGAIPPWDGKEDWSFYELEALFRLSAEPGCGSLEASAANDSFVIGE